MDSLPPGIDPSTIPIAPNPNGDPPNFVDPPSLAPAVLGVGMALIIISGIFVMLRLITNLKNTGRLALDDCMYIFDAYGRTQTLNEDANAMRLQIFVFSPRWEELAIGL